jgi:hypothetical protein
LGRFILQPLPESHIKQPDEARHESLIAYYQSTGGIHNKKGMVSTILAVAVS